MAKSHSSKYHDYGGLTMQYMSEYASYANMIRRCHNEQSKDWKNYGGRGIHVCQRWRRSFAKFLEDMGPKPTKGLTIERIDNNGSYTPSNCRWATPKEQARNKRRTAFVEYQGESICIMELAEKLNLTYATVASRVAKGWPMEKIIAYPVGRRACPFRIPPRNGVTKSLCNWAKEYGMSVGVLKARLRSGWSVEKALTTPVKKHKKRIKHPSEDAPLQ